MNTDSIHGYQHAGLTLSPIADFGYNFAATYGPGLLLAGGLLAAWAIGWGAARGIQRLAARRRLRRTPAAPDNQAGHDIDALIVCRGIDREPLRDGDIQRRAIRYLREKGEDQ